MLKRIISFLKDKTGDTIEAIIIAPIWIFILLIIGTQMTIYQAKQSLEDTAQVISRYVMLAESPDDAVNSVNNYLTGISDSKYYNKFSVNNMKKIYVAKRDNPDNTDWILIEDSNKYNSNWIEGNMVEIVLTRKTSFYNNTALSFCFLQILNEDQFCYSVVEETVSTRIIVWIGSVE